jgi:hypothetical protein
MLEEEKRRRRDSDCPDRSASQIGQLHRLRSTYHWKVVRKGLILSVRQPTRSWNSGRIFMKLSMNVMPFETF